MRFNGVKHNKSMNYLTKNMHQRGVNMRQQLGNLASEEEEIHSNTRVYGVEILTGIDFEVDSQRNRPLSLLKIHGSSITYFFRA